MPADLGPAIEAAAKAMDVAEYSYMLRGNLNERHIEAILTAALPELRKAIAEELRTEHSNHDEVVPDGSR